MVRRRTRKNPSLPSAPPKRRLAGGADPAKLESSLSRVRKLSKGLNERDRPFSPERPGTWHGSSRDLVVNRRLRRNSQLVVLTEEDYEALPESQRQNWPGYTYKMTYETWDQEAIEAGETDDKGWEEEGSEPYESLDAVLRATRDHSWVEWSDSNPDGKRSWLVSEDDEDHRTGDRTQYSLWIERADGLPKNQEEIDHINEAFGISNFGRMRRNAEQTRFPGMGVPPEIQIGTFSWRQVGGDMDPGGHGGLIARANGDQIELIEIQPVREYVGDSEAADVGFPFWTREASYDLNDLSLDKKDVQSALQSMDIDTDALEAITPDQRALAIAEALMRYGYAVEEGQAGWSKDIVRFPVEWWGGTTATFEEYCGDEDDEFRRDVLNEEWHYVYGSGMKGYLFDNGPYAAESVNDAIDSLVDTFTSGDPSISDDEEKRMRAALIKDGYWEFDNPKEIGAEYCEITREDGPMPEDEE